MTSIKIHNTVFENMKFHSLAMITGSLDLKNVTFSGISGALKEGQSFIEISKADSFSLREVTLKNLQ